MYGTTTTKQNQSETAVEHLASRMYHYVVSVMTLADLWTRSRDNRVYESCWLVQPFPVYFNLFSFGGEDLFPFTPTTSESIGDDGGGRDLQDVSLCSLCHESVVEDLTTCGSLKMKSKSKHICMLYIVQIEILSSYSVLDML